LARAEVRFALPNRRFRDFKRGFRLSDLLEDLFILDLRDPLARD
jgi:hypothetical protein